MNTLECFAKFTVDFKYTDIPKTTLQKAKYCIIDTLAVNIKGAQHPNAQKLAHSLVVDTVKGDSQEFISNKYTDAMTATFLNVYASHVYDYDDSCYAGMTHPSAMLVPTVLSLGQEKNYSGEKILTAFLVGFEVLGRFGFCLPNFYKVGWHCGPHFGVLGCAAAVAYLLDFSYEKTLHAMSLALCSASGLRAVNGTAAKPYTFAIAAQNAIFASRVAEAGITGSTEMLDGKEGYFKIVGNDDKNLETLNHLGKPFIIDEPGTCIKKHPVCSSAHAAIEAAEEIASQINDVSEIEKIVCETTSIVLKYLIINIPKTTMEAQFSIPYLVSTCLLHKQFNEKKHLTDEAIKDPDVNTLMNLVTYYASDCIDEKEFLEGACVIVHKKDGTSIRIQVDEAKGFAKNPFTEEELYIKFKACLEERFDEKTIQIYFKRLMELETLPSINTVFNI